MTEIILLVGGSKDGQRVHATPSQGRALQFAKDKLPLMQRDLKSLDEVFRVPYEIEYYTLEQIRSGNRYWWIGVHESLDVEDAIGQIIGWY
jgi:hypothetical protein